MTNWKLQYFEKGDLVVFRSPEELEEIWNGNFQIDATDINLQEQCFNLMGGSVLRVESTGLHVIVSGCKKLNRLPSILPYFSERPTLHHSFLKKLEISDV